jgi:GWxTD domain-containing protein
MRNSIYIFLLLLVVSACKSTQDATTQTKEFAALYNPSEYSLNVEYQIFHVSEDLTSLYIRLYPRQLLFNQANEESEYRALVQIDYSIFELDEDGIIISKADSSQFIIKLGPSDQERTAYFNAKTLQIPMGKKYLIRLNSKDLQRGTIGLANLFIDKENELSAQNFTIIARTGYPKFLNYFRAGELFRIDHRMFGEDTLYLDFLKSENEYPRPPVDINSPSAYPFETDTTIILTYTDTMMFSMPDEGVYYIRLDSSKKEGIALNNFGSDYPQVKSEKALLEPIFYIATLTEYRNLLEEKNTKRAVDDFWLKRSSSTERSRELIRVYYNRVLYSNLYFTASREGWKTDRGMVFILFGPPDRMKDTGNEQRWYYISRRQGKVIEFVFERKSSLYSNQDLVWKKSIESMQYWSSAVSSWRSGKVYSLGK